MSRFHGINGDMVQFTPEEEAEWDAREAVYQAAEPAEKETGIRTDRDRRIALTDWTGMSDVTMTADMATYRQALRDITSHANFPDLETEDWPTAPQRFK